MVRLFPGRQRENKTNNKEAKLNKTRFGNTLESLNTEKDIRNRN